MKNEKRTIQEMKVQKGVELLEVENLNKLTGGIDIDGIVTPEPPIAPEPPMYGARGGFAVSGRNST